MIPERFSDFLARLRKGSGERDRARLAAVLELNRALAIAEDRDSVLRLLLDEAIRLFAAERAFVVVPTDGGFAVAAARNLDREAVRQPERKVSTTVLHQSLGLGRAVLSDDAAVGELAASQSIADLKLRSVMCVPLRAGARTLGCLYLDHRFHAGVFGSDDLHWLEAFADQAAIALHLHELLEHARAHRVAVERDNEALAREVTQQAVRLGELEQLRRVDLAHPYDEIVGESPALIRYLRVLDRVIGGDFPVLILGESGSGKELAARAIHRYGRRSSRPYVAVNVATIRPELLESELFGHVRGAFTGADRDRSGLVREADGGVLFLDEIAEMPLELQAKLLRFLEERSLRPVGGDATVPVDLRVVAATNRDPQRALQDGLLREDLYYRLAVVTIEVPPLRERRGDLPSLVAAFLAGAAAGRGGPPRRPSAELLADLARRHWAGNVRELRNVVLQLDAMADQDVLEPSMLAAESAAHGEALPTLDLAGLEAAALRAALEAAGGNRSEAARLLGISRRSLYDRLKRGGLA